MGKVYVIGHFGFGLNCCDGQTIKTKIVTEELQNVLGKGCVKIYDTHNTLKLVALLPLYSFVWLLNSEHVIIMPGQNGMRLLPFWLCFWNILFRRKLHYVVIGGWLAEFLKAHSVIKRQVRSFDFVYVETRRLQDILKQIGVENVVVVPNCKELEPTVSERSLPKSPFKLCTFSRVIKEKGIEEAIASIKICRSQGLNVNLDIYGMIEDHAWFDRLMESQPDYICYKGVVEYSHSVQILEQYHALLFPTYYDGECFPGTLIDAMAAGIPAFVSDWHDNKYIIENGRTGFVHEVHNVEVLASQITTLMNDESLYGNMRKEMFRMSNDYLPSNALKPLVEKLL